MLSVKTLVLLALLLPFSGHVRGQLATTSINDLTDSVRLRPKPALIFISTNWCTYCRMQKAQLKKHREFQSASDYLYFSAFDAETREPITFNGHTYTFKGTGVSTGSHELAFLLGNIDGRLAFPTWVLIDEHFEIIFKFPGVIKPKELTTLLEAIQRHRQSR